MLRCLSFLIALLFTISAPLFSETIGDVEFHLPDASWKKQETLSPLGGQSESLLYSQETEQTAPPKAFFLAHKNLSPAGPFEEAALQKALSLGLPGMTIQVTILLKNPDDILFEWSAFDKKEEKMHGFVRLFARKDTTVLLQFLTENQDNLEKDKKLWLPVLQEAKVLPNP